MATHSTFNTHSITNGNGGVMADHTHSSDLDSLMDKVNMNTAFTNLARNDAMLVNEMKNAITELYKRAKRREVLYIAIEHNTKYITELLKASDKAKNEGIQ